MSAEAGKKTSNGVVYLDNNATTAVDPAVFEAMTPFLRGKYGNPSSIHAFGGEVANDVEAAREYVAALLGASHPRQVVFTSCGTESDNAAILSALRVCPKKSKIVMSRVEHPAVLNMGKELERGGHKVCHAPVDGKGRIDVTRYAEMVDDDTAVVSIMWANNEVGNVYPVEELAKIAHNHGALFHTDAVQAVGKLPIHLAESSIDMLTLSGHKIHAPKGVGALYIRRGVRFHPYLIGGHQERGRRGGTENVPGIVALGKAAELAMGALDEEMNRVRALRDRLERGLTAAIPSCRVNGDLERRLPNTSSVSFDFVEGEAILLHLDHFGVCASSGSACTTGSLEPSHVLRAMGLPYTSAHGTIRFSLSRFNTEEEIDRVVELMPPIIKTLRGISPYWKED